MRLLLALALLVPVAASAQPAAAPPQPAPASSGVAIKCSEWNKTPDGDWKSGPNATVSDGSQHLTFKGERVEEGSYTIGGQDLYALLEQTCGS